MVKLGAGKCFLGRHGWRYRIAVIAILLVACCGLCRIEFAFADDVAPNAGGEQSGGKASGEERPSPPVGPPAQIEGFRQARFGMTEDQVRQAIRKDFPAAAAKLTTAIHPSEKTTVLALSVTDLLPHTGLARISYILGYRSKKLTQINILWTSDDTAAGDEIVVGIANALRDYFTSENFKPDSIVVNHQLAANTILVFRGSDDHNRTVILLLSGVAASARAEEKKTPNPPPLTLELSYIENPAHPDVFKIGKGQF